MIAGRLVNGHGIELAERPVASVLEFAAFSFPPGGAFVVGWPAEPGAARHDALGRPVLLHFAPARWLAPAPSAEITALISAAEHAGAGTAVDVSGKWREFSLLGQNAARALASTINLELVLAGRECAAVTLFDCPCVLARIDDGFVIWVRASYVADFVAAIKRLNRLS